MTDPKVSAPDPPARVYPCFRCGSHTSYFPGRLCKKCAEEKAQEVET